MYGGPGGLRRAGREAGGVVAERLSLEPYLIGFNERKLNKRRFILMNDSLHSYGIQTGVTVLEHVSEMGEDMLALDMLGGGWKGDPWLQWTTLVTQPFSRSEGNLMCGGAQSYTILSAGSSSVACLSSMVTFSPRPLSVKGGRIPVPEQTPETGQGYESGR